MVHAIPIRTAASARNRFDSVRPPRPLAWAGIGPSLRDCAAAVPSRLIPNVPLIDLDSVTFAQGAELVLERHLLVVLGLIGDVLLQLFRGRFAHGENSVARLPDVAIDRVDEPQRRVDRVVLGPSLVDMTLL